MACKHPNLAAQNSRSEVSNQLVKSAGGGELSDEPFYAPFRTPTLPCQPKPASGYSNSSSATTAIYLNCATTGLISASNARFSKTKNCFIRAVSIRGSTHRGRRARWRSRGPRKSGRRSRKAARGRQNRQCETAGRVRNHWAKLLRFGKRVVVSKFPSEKRQRRRISFPELNDYSRRLCRQRAMQLNVFA